MPEPFNTPHGIIPFVKVELEHILAALNVALEEDRKQVQAIIDNPQPATFENTIAALARVGQKRDLIARYMHLFYGQRTEYGCVFEEF